MKKTDKTQSTKTVKMKCGLHYSGRDVVLSLQHMFAMLGATVLVPILANMSIAMAMISAGLGTIIFYFVTKKKVPVFLGSSFAFLPALISIVGTSKVKYSPEWNTAMASVMIGLLIAGVIYIIIAGIIKVVGVKKVKKFFPPIVVGPVIIIIGMILAPKTFYNNIIGQSIWFGVEPWKEWTTAIITMMSIVAINAYAKPKSFLKVIPILLGFVIGYVYAFGISFAPGGSLVSYIVQENGVFSAFDLSQAFSSSRIVIFQNLDKEFGFYTGFKDLTGSLVGTSILAIAPIAIVTFMEHLGDISANSTVCGKDFMVDPGLHRTVLGDGIATAVSGLLGGPANTTYGENTAVLAMTKNYEPKNIFLAAIFAIVFGMFTVFADFIATIPSAVIGGASIILYGMISASGLRALVDGKVDFSNTKNIIVVATVLAVGLGLGAMSLVGDVTGDNVYKIMAGTVEISPLAIATLLGIVMNLIIPNSKPISDEQKKAFDEGTQMTLASSGAIDIEEVKEEKMQEGILTDVVEDILEENKVDNQIEDENLK